MALERFPTPWMGHAGVMVAVSTPASTRISKQNQMQVNRIIQGGIKAPEYLKFECYFYTGMVFGNVKDLHTGEYDPLDLGLFENVLEIMCEERGIEQWRQLVGMKDGEYFKEVMRRLLGVMRIPLWGEITSGLSYAGYAYLDVYHRILSPLMESPPEEIHFWVYDAVSDPLMRRIPRQDQWWCFPVWECVGQSATVMDWNLDMRIPMSLQKVLTDMGISQPEDLKVLPERERARALVLLKQVYPDPEVLLTATTEEQVRRIEFHRAQLLRVRMLQYKGKGKGKGRRMLGDLKPEVPRM